MIRNTISRSSLILVVLLIMTSAMSAFAANIAVPATHLTNQAIMITANTLKPTNCSAITLTTIVFCPAGGRNCDGSAADELILGSPDIDIIQGKGGADCILGGGGDDDITGSQARDICIGGPGTDTFKKCETTIQ